MEPLKRVPRAGTCFSFRLHKGEGRRPSPGGIVRCGGVVVEGYVLGMAGGGLLFSGREVDGVLGNAGPFEKMYCRRVPAWMHAGGNHENVVQLKTNKINPPP